MDCGKPLTASAAAAASQPAAAGVPSTRVQAAEGKADVKCPTCGHAVDGSLAFCAFCGAKLAGAPKTAPTPAPCPKCGATITSAEFKFCPSCAAPLGAAAPAGPATTPLPRDSTSTFSAQRSQPKPPVQLALMAEDGTRTERFPLVGEETTVGRSGADIPFADDTYLSPIHAMLIWKDGKLSIRDLGSRNGTWMFLEGPHKLVDGDLILVGSQIFRFRRLGYPGPNPPEADATRRMGSLVPSADIASLAQLRADGSVRDVFHLSPGRDITIGRDKGDWPFPYDPSMSGAHAVVRSEDADFVVLDAGSRNGVAVAARGDLVLHKGSRMLVGDKLLVVEMP